jgi:hypothetical protein
MRLVTRKQFQQRPHLNRKETESSPEILIGGCSPEEGEEETTTNTKKQGDVRKERSHCTHRATNTLGS